MRVPRVFTFCSSKFFFRIKRSDYVYGSLVSYDSGLIKAWDDLIDFQHGSKIEIHRSRWTRFRVHHRISMSNVSSVMEICFASRSRSPGRGVVDRDIEPKTKSTTLLDKFRTWCGNEEKSDR